MKFYEGLELTLIILEPSDIVTLSPSKDENDNNGELGDWD